MGRDDAIAGLRGALNRLARLATGIVLLFDAPAAAAPQPLADPAPGAIEPCAPIPIVARPDAPATAPGAPPAMRRPRDFPNLCRYRDDNAAILRAGRHAKVVFLGDSITEFWQSAQPDLFDDKVVDRGISGQTTPQMLLRFYADVVALHPRVVHIMAGTNDIAGNTGPMTDDQIFDNIRAMLDIAAVNHIRVVLGSITPATANSRNRPPARILALNARLRELARQRGAIFVDYYTPLSDGRNNIRAAFTHDGLHPNRDGYAVMRPLTERALAQALR